MLIEASSHISSFPLNSLKTANMLKLAFLTFQKGTLYAHWALANPGENQRLMNYYLTGVNPPQLSTATGQAFVLLMQAYFQLIA